MVQWLNKILWSFAFLLSLHTQGQSAGAGSANQSDYSDYKDADQHERFYKRRKAVGAWQINQLKHGAVIVRLKTNTRAINGLRAKGNALEADMLEAETFVINKNTVAAWLENFNFCKVYFIYSGASDSLLKGGKSGFFLDTNLVMDPAIVMNGAYYIIAERDYAYNSSIGFVTEAQARKVVERGNPAKPMAFILKNKYGHQLKNPMPHEVPERSTGAGFYLPVSILPAEFPHRVSYSVNRNPPEKLEKADALGGKKPITLNQVAVPKHFTYFKLAQSVSQLNSDLSGYYQKTPAPELDKIPEDVKPFLY